jgi:hypothetical protein
VVGLMAPPLSFFLPGCHYVNGSFTRYSCHDVLCHHKTKGNGSMPT